MCYVLRARDPQESLVANVKGKLLGGNKNGGLTQTHALDAATKLRSAFKEKLFLIYISFK